MSLDTLREALPDYAKDLKLNLGALASETVLNDQQKWGCFLAAAHAGGVGELVRAFEAEAETRMTPETRQAAKAAAAIMAMNNVYYRALHLLENDEYRTLRAGLRMNALANHGAAKVDFELWSLAVSAINGCGACLDSHEAELRQHGATNIQIQAALRIAAVVAGASAVLRAERELAA
jgi:lipoyl-dependent peroxiredoxin subunit D